MKVYAGLKYRGARRQRRGGRVTAIRAAIDAYFGGIDEVLFVQPLPRRLDVLVFCGSCCAALCGFMKLISITDAQPVVYGKDHETQTREILIGGVGVRIIIRIVPA